MRSGYEKASQTIGITIMRFGYEKASQTIGFTISEVKRFGISNRRGLWSQGQGLWSQGDGWWTLGQLMGMGARGSRLTSARQRSQRTLRGQRHLHLLSQCLTAGTRRQRTLRGQRPKRDQDRHLHLLSQRLTAGTGSGPYEAKGQSETKTGVWTSPAICIIWSKSSDESSGPPVAAS